MSSGPCAGFASQSKWHWALSPAPPIRFFDPVSFRTWVPISPRRSIICMGTFVQDLRYAFRNPSQSA